jgi:hypothetical protein
VESNIYSDGLEISAFYTTWSLVPMVTEAYIWSIFWVRWIQSVIHVSAPRSAKWYSPLRLPDQCSYASYISCWSHSPCSEYRNNNRSRALDQYETPQHADLSSLLLLPLSYAYVLSRESCLEVLPSVLFHYYDGNIAVYIYCRNCRFMYHIRV